MSRVDPLDRFMEIPIVGAPLAGGPSTPELAASVSEAGGLGFIAAGYKAAHEVGVEVEAVRGRTQRPFGVNIFFPVRLEPDDAAIADYVNSLADEERRYGVACGDPRWTGDDWEEKLELVERERPAVVSFTFGCPDRGTVERLRANAIAVWCTVTQPAEATIAAAARVDALIVQGAEAGGHQASFDDTDTTPTELLPLLRLIHETSDLPLVAAGGIADGEGVAAAIAAGASAAQVGTALMLTPEAGTTASLRGAFSGDAPTALTRAFTGRRGRGIVNRFMREHDAVAPKAYPQIHSVTAPLRAAARAAEDADGINLWAGQSYRLAKAEPAAELVTRWAGEARLALL
jgi:nitronate monooxygenase